MADRDAQQFLREYLIQQPLPKRAVSSSIQFLKERIGPSRQLHAVRYRDEAGGHWQYIYGVERDGAGSWRSCGGFGGGGGPAYESIARPYPWANLGATWGETGLLAGGEVADNGEGVVSVRLVGPEDLALEDTLDNGIVLFMTDSPIHDVFQITAELYDASGRLVGSHPAFGSPH